MFLGDDKSIKRLLLIFVVFLLMGIGGILNIPSSVVIAEAASLTYDGFKFDIQNGCAGVNGYTGSKSDLYIPSYVYSGGKSYKVTSINYSAFVGNSKIKSIKIPGTVETIGGSAFNGCYNLSSVQLSEGLKTIGDHAFWSCSGIKSINLPRSLTTLSSYCFDGCWGLNSINIPSNVSNIHFTAFVFCSSLKSINVDANNKKYSSINGIVYNKAKTSIELCPPALSGEFSVPYGITKIGNYAFYSCCNLEKINLPSNITSIGTFAFGFCKGIKNIAIPKNVQTIPDYCFNGCGGLLGLSIPDNVTSIGGNSFQGCSSLKFIEIPNKVTSIANNSFDGCSSLENFIYTNRTQISDSLIPSLCKSFYKVSLKNGNYNEIQLVKPLSKVKTHRNNSIYNINVNNKYATDFTPTSSSSYNFNIRKIKNSDFNIDKTEEFSGYCSKVNLKGNNNLVSFDNKEFKDKIEITNNNKTNKTLFIKYSNREIAEGQIDLSNLKIDNVIPKIDIEGDFDNAKEQVSLTIKKVYGESGAKVTVSKNGHAEQDVNGDNYTAYENGVYKFKITSGSGLVSEKTVEVSNIDNKNYLSYSFNDRNNTASVKGYIGRCKYVTIPETVEMYGKTYRVTSIGNNAFKNCTSIVGVKMPASITTIKGYAFCGCSNLKSINIPSGMENIYIYAFADCVSLEKVEIPSSMIKVGKYAFLNCLSLKEVSISKNTQVYDNSTFRKCGAAFRYI